MHRVIDKLLLRYRSDFDSHLTDESLADLFCGDLTMMKSWTARRHLAKCAACRARQEQLLGPRAERMLEFYRESLDSAEMELLVTPRMAFSRWLDRRFRKGLFEEKRPSPRLRLSAVFPVALFGIASLLLGALGFSLWSRERQPEMAANTLLLHAENCEERGATADAGVAHQTVQIKTPNLTMKRSLYWDLQGKRKPKQAPVPVAEEALRTTLSQAGVDWNRPISAVSYQTWRNQQQRRSDKVISNGSHLLTLTTAVPEGVVLEQSLTVRDTDFHPVKRMVEFRNSQTVEIAELDFKVLPWTAVEPGIFEPLGGSLNAAVTDAPNGLSAFRPLTPTYEQLDETELAARLVLNQLHADVGEQIEIRRTAEGVEVEGLVETDERKRELSMQLMTVPRLKISLQSAEHLRESPPPAGQFVSVNTSSDVDQPSVLEKYLQSRGRSLHDVNVLSQQFFSVALAIGQESKAIQELKTRFASTEQMPLLASATLEELIYSHRERLQGALRQERLLLDEIAGQNVLQETASVSGSGSLIVEATRNLALVKELTQTNLVTARSAEAIFIEISSAVTNIASATRATSQTAASKSTNSK